MLYCPNKEMFPNKFVETQLPTKGQIFDRTGQRAVCPAGSYTGDESARFASCSTEGAEALARAAEAYAAEVEAAKAAAAKAAAKYHNNPSGNGKAEE